MSDQLIDLLISYQGGWLASWLNGNTSKLLQLNDGGPIKCDDTLYIDISRESNIFIVLGIHLFLFYATAH